MRANVCLRLALELKHTPKISASLRICNIQSIDVQNKLEPYKRNQDIRVLKKFGKKERNQGNHVLINHAFYMQESLQDQVTNWKIGKMRQCCTEKVGKKLDP